MTQEQTQSLSFETDIRPLFRQYDIDEMVDISGFDLSDYSDVKKRAKLIYTRLADGSMPCDNPWTEEKIALFKNWMDQGRQP